MVEVTKDAVLRSLSGVGDPDRDGNIVTRDLSNAILPGVTRREIMDAAQIRDVDIVQINGLLGDQAFHLRDREIHVPDGQHGLG